jgi:hypothetical protein
MRSCQVVRLWHQLDFKGLKGTDARSLQLDFPKLTSAFHRSRVSTGEVAASGSFTFASDRHIDNADLAQAAESLLLFGATTFPTG